VRIARFPAKWDTPGLPSSFQGMIENRPITLIGRTTDAIVAMLLSLRVQLNGNHNRVHASFGIAAGRGPQPAKLVIDRVVGGK
jgi:hypothetical protein